MAGYSSGIGFYGDSLASNGCGLENCYSLGDVSGNTYAGGIAGYTILSGIIKNCYTAGNIYSSSASVGGVVGLGRLGRTSTTIKNCIALNKSIEGAVGRIVNGGALSNNYSRSDMDATVGGTPYIPDDTINADDNKDGADITEAQWNSADWWEHTALFDPEVWELADGRLPVLIGVGGPQNPQVQAFDD